MSKSFFERKVVPIIHYATGVNTCCGVYISGRANQTPVQHTVVHKNVTCYNCRRAFRFNSDWKKLKS